MVSTSSFLRLPLVLCLAAVSAYAQNPAEEPIARGAADGAISTRKDARTITLKIPAPRGQIVDRNGAPIAQNQVAYQVALQFRQFENADRNFVVNWARTRLDALQILVKNQIEAEWQFENNSQKAKEKSNTNKIPS